MPGLDFERPGGSMSGAVLFDLDGTLADTAPDLVAAVNEALRRYGLEEKPLHALRGYGSRGGRGLLRAALLADETPEQFQLLFEAFLEAYARCVSDRTVLFEGIAELLTALDEAGITWGVVTNKGAAYAEPLIARLRLYPHCTVAGSPLLRPKPHPEALLKAASLLRTDPARCVYVGDDGKDILAGFAAGMTTVAAGYGYSRTIGDEVLFTANHLVESVMALRKLLFDLPMLRD